MLTFLNFLTLIFIIFSCHNRILSLSEWISDIKLVSANCNKATIRTKCPQLSTNRYIELTFYSIKSKIPSQLNVFQCRKNQSNSIQTTFALSCKDLYRVNVSLFPTYPIAECKEFCSDVHTSNIWLLGNEECDEFVDNCQFSQYIMTENKCLNSSMKCFNTSDIQVFIPSTIMKNFRLIKANCFNATFEMNCSNLPTDRTIVLKLHGNKLNNDNYSVILQRCEFKLEKSIEITFPIVCKQLYYVSLNSTLNSFKCTNNCSNVETSQSWLLGSSYCNNDKIDNYCKYDQYKTNVNTCLNSSEICQLSTGTVKSISENPVKNLIQNANIRLIFANCKYVFLGFDCPINDEPRYIEFHLHNGKEFVEIKTLKCQSRPVQVKFTLKCRSLYYITVNLGLIVSTLQCDVHCEKSIISNKWFLGSEVCNDSPTDDCKYDQYKTVKNECRDTPQICSNSLQYRWSPNLTVIEAHCKNATVQTECPKLSSISIIKLSIFIYKNRKPMNTISAYCAANRNEIINVTFDINCMNLYRFTVEINSSDNGNKSFPFQSSILLLGKDKCDKENIEYCENIKHKGLNQCDYGVVNCSNQIDSAGIAVIVFIVALLFSLIYFLVYFIKYGKRLTIYRKMNSQPNLSPHV